MASEDGPRPESPLWKWLVLGPTAVIVAGALWFIAAFVLGDPLDNTSEVPCSKVASFAGGKLPEERTDEHCTERSALDVQMRGSFRMPRAAVTEWLDTSFPGSRKHDLSRFSSCECDMDLDIQTPPAGARAAAVQITIVYENADTASVDLLAFTV
ncbi:hypothetical protein [Streptomyces palmae]|uniref:Uncharacterized protein n=1 Tax=Streptomyces palmae TaxID=1701085 RepID=A0A4Z0H593_9ACTN|nr:hypothetical protein [Streptomyces palmae]TGB05751.1 hypothetical protein E4099_18985 [Streptomyces palmae]